MDADPRSLPARQPQARLLPLDGVSARSLARQQHRQSAARSGRGTTCQGQEPGLDRSARAGAGRGSGQRRLGPVGGVFSRFDGDDAIAGDRLRLALRIRHVQAVDQGWLAGRTTGQLAAGRIRGRCMRAGRRGSEAQLRSRFAAERCASTTGSLRSDRHPARPVVGYGGKTINTLRLWAAGAPDYFDFQQFSRAISSARWPRRSPPRRSRACCIPTIQRFAAGTAIRAGILSRRLLAGRHRPSLPRANTIGIAAREGRHSTQRHAPDAGRAGVDADSAGRGETRLGQAWDLTRRTLAYTNHTLLAGSAGEMAGGVVRDVLPRHLEIIYEINRRFLDDVRALFPATKAASSASA